MNKTRLKKLEQKVKSKPEPKIKYDLSKYTNAELWAMRDKAIKNKGAKDE